MRDKLPQREPFLLKLDRCDNHDSHATICFDISALKVTSSGLEGVSLLAKTSSPPYLDSEARILIPEGRAAPTIKHRDGRTLLFSCEDFVSDICRGNHCFVCGAASGTKPFNDEHIVPRWVLRRYGLFEKSITLPNGELRRYGGYRVPCCTDCNDLLGRELETPVSTLLDGPFSEVKQRLDAPSTETIFVWLCLLFLKTHLKDNLVPVQRDRRMDEGLIGDLYEWSDLHHLHSVARSPYTGARLSPNVFGSLCIFEVYDEVGADDFDYIDLSFEQTVAVRLGNIGLIAVFNDSGASMQAWSHLLAKITGPLDGFQFREVAAKLAVANRDLNNRPEYGTLFSQDLDQALIFCKTDPEPVWSPYDPVAFGHCLEFALKARMTALQIDGSRDIDFVTETIRSGRVTFLFDEEENFLQIANIP